MVTKKTKKTVKAHKPKVTKPTGLIEAQNPFNDLIDFEKSFFENDFTNLFGKVNLPSVDVENRKDEIEVSADLPGIDRKDIKICVNKDSVEITAEKKIEQNIKHKDYYKQERSYSGYHRTIALPAIVDPNKTKCDFINGTLKITIKKLHNTNDQPKMISLK